MSYLQKTWPLIFSIITHVLVIGCVLSTYSPPEFNNAQTESLTVRLDNIVPKKIPLDVITPINKITRVPSVPKVAPIVESVSKITKAVDTEIVEQQSATKIVEESTIIKEEFSPPRLDADYLHNPTPEYPLMSRRRGEQGRVLLSVTISSTGDAELVTISKSSGYAMLDQSALKAVKTWRFVPARLNNEPIFAEVIVPVRFTLGS